jgi:hypothetical protein
MKIKNDVMPKPEGIEKRNVCGINTDAKLSSPS